MCKQAELGALMDALVLESVTKAFDGVCAVEGLSARVPAGCIYGLLGPNGAGKTTALRMIMSIFRPDEGRIEVLGQRSVREAKDRVGYMPEERGLYPHAKVLEVLVYMGSLKGMAKAEARSCAAEWLERVQLTEWAERKVQDLSRGMQQRLQFVATVLHEPELVILDEPFAGLDPVNQNTVIEFILQLRAEGRTVLLSTHMMEQAELLCDRILLLNEGRKVLDGTLDEVKREEEASAVAVVLEGETDFIADLPMVSDVTPSGKELHITLVQTDQEQELLKELIGRVRVRSFRVRTPTLREVFVNAVSQQNA